MCTYTLPPTTSVLEPGYGRNTFYTFLIAAHKKQAGTQVVLWKTVSQCADLTPHRVQLWTLCSKASTYLGSNVLTV